MVIKMIAGSDAEFRVRLFFVRPLDRAGAPGQRNGSLSVKLGKILYMQRVFRKFGAAVKEKIWKILVGIPD